MSHAPHDLTWATPTSSTAFSRKAACATSFAWRARAGARRTSMRVQLRGAARHALGRPEQRDGRHIACVVPSLTEPMVGLREMRLRTRRDGRGAGIRTGMAILIENPREVGADRIADAVAGYDRAKGASSWSTSGRRPMFDCVTPKGEYSGGVLAPGLQISADALFARAAKLPASRSRSPRRSSAETPSTRCSPGSSTAYVGLVDGIRRAPEGRARSCAVIATGGLAPLIAPLSKTIAVDDVLTLVRASDPL